MVKALTQAIPEQTLIPNDRSAFRQPNLKFNPIEKVLSKIVEDFRITRNEGQVGVGIVELFLQKGTPWVSGEDPPIFEAPLTGTQIVRVHNPPSAPVTRSSYRGLYEEYDVAEIEELHMRAANKYGW